MPSSVVTVLGETGGGVGAGGGVSGVAISATLSALLAGNGLNEFGDGTSLISKLTVDESVLGDTEQTLDVSSD